jgi:hypothetical protein
MIAISGDFVQSSTKNRDLSVLIFRLDIHSQEYCNNVKYANMYKHVCGHMYMWLYVLSNSRKAKYVGMYICSLRVTMLLQIESKVLYISTYVCK